MARPPDRVMQFGRAAIGEARPNPLFGKVHIMDGTELKTADKTGVYTLVDGTPVRIKKGDPIPDGAEFRDAKEDRPMSPRAAERARIAKAAKATRTETRIANETATENRARGKAAEQE